MARHRGGAARPRRRTPRAHQRPPRLLVRLVRLLPRHRGLRRELSRDACGASYRRSPRRIARGARRRAVEQLEGKVAVVTGGGSGIGEGIAQACAAAGMRVVIADIEADAAERSANSLRESGAEAIAVPTDVTDRDALDALADEAWEAFGAVHLLCNNAGVITVGEIASTTPGDWQWLFGVNVFGVVHGIQAFVPRMREQGGEAHIVNTGSMSSISATRAVEVGVYCATKHAALGLSETLRNELEDDGIGVSILCPGGVATQLFAADRNLPDELRGRVTPRVEERREVERIPPRDVGEMVLRAVRENRFWIITHPERRGTIERRAERLLAAFDEAAARAG
ncbi:MAG: SDR family NAD(P)-dependent oxidoreductase [Chloroflexi bacterium]|nr:SDR family NAD(P)-dependent oxidoreductase [Chloroflexota bacterium]